MDKQKLKAGLFALGYRLESLEKACNTSLKQVKDELEQSSMIALLTANTRLYCVQKEVKELQQIIKVLEEAL
ncbi:MAG: hypothetical protein HXK75_01700 [Granulicatella sp.]|nr:hypothetical protein [Granulicatella sp.]